MRLLRAIGFLICWSATAAAAGEKTAPLVTAAPPGTPWVHYLEAIRSSVNESGAARVMLDIYPSSILGGELHAIQQMRRGRIAMGLFTTTSLAAVAPSLKVLDLPFIWRDQSQATYVLDYAGQQIFSPPLERAGIVLIAFNPSGVHHMAARRSLTVPKMAKGLRPRALQADISLAFWRFLSANPVALAYPDVTPSLQTGLIDGLSIELQSIYYGEYYKFAPHITLTGHALEVGALVASKSWFDELTPAQQENLLKTARDHLASSRAETRALEQELIEKLRASEAHVHDLSPAERLAWESRLAGFRADMVKSLGREAQTAIARLQEAKANIARWQP